MEDIRIYIKHRGEPIGDFIPYKLGDCVEIEDVNDRVATRITTLNDHDLIIEFAPDEPPVDGYRIQEEALSHG